MVDGAMDRLQHDVGLVQGLTAVESQHGQTDIGQRLIASRILGPVLGDLVLTAVDPDHQCGLGAVEIDR